jgi:DUF1365 family protein
VKSRLYTGTLRHRRHLPREHAFSYRVFMPYLHLGELDEVLAMSPLWTRGRWGAASFLREDFHGDPELSLDSAVRRTVEAETGERPAGPIYLLGNLRYFGFQMNPIACYYCFDEDGETLKHLVAEVTNTPWNERHSYVLTAEPGERILRQRFDKAFHVSPFNPMAMRYDWRSNVPGERLAIHLENHSDRGREFDATLALAAEPLSRAAMHRVLWQFPLMTGKVALGIYYEAFKLFLKRVPLYPHPGTTSTTGAKS